MSGGDARDSSHTITWVPFRGKLTAEILSNTVFSQMCPINVRVDPTCVDMAHDAWWDDAACSTLHCHWHTEWTSAGTAWLRRADPQDERRRGNAALANREVAWEGWGTDGQRVGLVMSERWRPWRATRDPVSSGPPPVPSAPPGPERSPTPQTPKLVNSTETA